MFLRNTHTSFNRQRLGAAGIAVVYAGISSLWIFVSDSLLRLTVNDAGLQNTIELSKGLTFVAITSGLLFFLLKGWNASNEITWLNEEENKGQMRHLLLVFMMLALFVPAIGCGVIILQSPQAKEEAFANLSAIADLKSKQIESWVTQQHNVSTALQLNAGFIHQVDAFVNTKARRARNDIVLQLEAARQANGFEEAWLLDRNGHTLLSVGDHHPIGSLTQKMVSVALASGKVERSSHFLDDSDTMHIDYVVPLPSQGTHRNAIGVVIFHVNPEQFLFPYIARWPGNQASGKTLVVRKDGDSVLFLNRQSHLHPKFNRTRMPVTDTANPAVAAINNSMPGTLDGTDYRGISVLAAYQPVAGTNWHVVTKMDREEALRPVYRLGLWISLISLFAIVGLCIAMLILWRQYRQLHQLSIERKNSKLLSQFFNLPFIGMGITTPDMSHWLQYNDRLCEILGYSKEALSKISWHELTHPDDVDLNIRELERMQNGETDGYKINRRVINKRGDIIFVSVNVKCVRDAGNKIDVLVLTMEDVTQQKKSKARIEKLSQLYAALSLCNQAIVRSKNEDVMFHEICRAAVQYGGMKMGCIAMLEPAGQYARILASYGTSHDLEDGEVAFVNPSHSPDPITLSIQNNCAVWCHDSEYVPFAENIIQPERWHQWPSVAALPLRRQGRTVGAFFLATDENMAFDDEVKALLQEMTHDISFALDTFDVEKRRILAQSQLQLAANVFEQSGEAIVIADASGHIVNVNKAFSNLTGFHRSEALGKHLRQFGIANQIRGAFHSIRATLKKQRYWQGELLLRKKNGNLYLAWLSLSHAPHDDAQTDSCIVIFNDITEHKANEEKLEWLMHFDTLTGLSNRNLLNDRCNQAINLADNRGTHLAMLFLDIDHFKNINDSLGYHVGDALIVALAKRLKSSFQDKDTISRLGGDNFVALIPDTSANDVANQARNFLEETMKPYFIDDHELSVTASIGIAMYPQDGQDFESLSKCADAAMFRAKAGGRNTYCFFAPAMQKQADRHLEIENALRRALDRKQFTLHYQPQMALDTGHIIGAEVLLRWHHPELGNVSPAEFIPIAENCGMILPIGEWILRTALRQYRLWLNQGVPAFTLAINISAVQFRHPDLPHLVMSILNETGVSPRCLELELTESFALEDPESAIAVVDRFDQMGIRVSIDDFGTGYSSLNYLKRLKIYKLKIDRSFVSEIANNQGDRVIVGAIVNMAKSLGLHTIAEGVETDEQTQFLQTNGCDEIQGYLFSRPLTTESFFDFIKQYKKN